MITAEDIIGRFNKEEVLILTPQEELVILHELIDQSCIDTGSSRAVYDFYDKYVVKIGISIEGQAQNQIEYNYYTKYDNTYFATLYARGRFINIMEKVYDTMYWEPDCDEAETEEQTDAFNELVRIVNDITDYYGGDNGQLGWSKEREAWVCYDYGYSEDWEKSDIVGNMEDWSTALEIVQLAINGIITDHDYTYKEIDRMALFNSLEELPYWATEEEWN